MQEKSGAPEEIRPYLEGTALIEALDYWIELRGEQELPRFDDFDPMAIPRLLASVLLVDCFPDGEFRYRLAGSNLEQRYQVDSVAGKTPEDLFGSKVENVLKPYRRVCRERCLFFRSASRDWLVRDPRFIAYKVVLLPFGDPERGVTNLLGAFDIVRD